MKKIRRNMKKYGKIGMKIFIGQTKLKEFRTIEYSYLEEFTGQTEE